MVTAESSDFVARKPAAKPVSSSRLRLITLKSHEVGLLVWGYDACTLNRCEAASTATGNR